MSTNTKILQIVNGPSSHEIVDAFKYAFHQFEPKVKFTIILDGQKTEVKVKILGIEHEGGGGYSYNITGEVRPNDDFEQSVKIYFNTKSREGHVIVTEK